MKPKLVLITSRFPLPFGESFIESELPYLCKEFDIVEIVPVFTKWNSSVSDSLHIRSIPSNAVFRSDIYEFIRTQMDRSNFFQVMRIMLDSQIRTILLNEFPFALKFGIKGLIELFKAIKMAFCVRDACCNYFSTETEPFIFYSYWLDSPALGAAISNCKHAHVVSRAHRYDLYWYASKPPYRPLQEKTISLLEKVYIISADGYKYLLNRYPFFEEKLCLSRLGVNNPIKKRSGLPSDGIFHLVSCSSLTSVKRVDLIIDALAKIKYPTVWDHFGTGVLSKELHEQALALPKNIIVNWRGLVQNHEILRWYADNPVDVFINTSESEGVPVSIMEALSFGIPVIATNVGGTGELVNDNNGIMLTSNPSVDEVLKALHAYNEFPLETKLHKRDNAYSTWLEKANAEDVYSVFTQNLRKTIIQ